MPASDIMQRSPHDASTARTPELVQITRRKPTAWVPSRFNARTIDADGRMILWNTYSGAISAFGAENVPLLERLLSQRGFTGPLTGIAKYLYERGYIVPEDTDERQRLQFTFGKQQYRTDMLHLILLTSEDCNFRCVYCYEHFQRGTMSKSTREAVKNLVRKRAPRLRKLSISYFGGEPLYGLEAIEDLAPFFKEIVSEHRLDFSGSMTTNGYLLTPAVADNLLDWGVRTFQITLDGPPEYHDCKRKGRDGRGTFATIFANLQAMRARTEEFLITIRVNFDMENSPYLHELVGMAGAEFGGDPRFRMAFHAVGKWGGPNDADLDTCGLKEAKDVRRELTLAAIDEGFDVRGLERLAEPGTGVCYAARPYSFVIGADGKLMKCTVALDSEAYNIVGKILPDGELELDEDRMALWTEPAFENDPGCGKCYLVPVCQGMHCPLIRIRSGERPCPSMKSELHSSLIGVYRAGRDKAPRVSVS